MAEQRVAQRLAEHHAPRDEGAGDRALRVRPQQHADLGDHAHPVDPHRHRLDVEDRHAASHVRQLGVGEPGRVRLVGLGVGRSHGAHAPVSTVTHGPSDHPQRRRHLRHLQLTEIPDAVAGPGEVADRGRGGEHQSRRPRRGRPRLRREDARRRALDPRLGPRRHHHRGRRRCRRRRSSGDRVLGFSQWFKGGPGLQRCQVALPRRQRRGRRRRDPVRRTHHVRAQRVSPRCRCSTRPN